MVRGRGHDDSRIESLTRPITYGNIVVVSHTTGCSFSIAKRWELFPMLYRLSVEDHLQRTAKAAITFQNLPPH